MGSKKPLVIDAGALKYAVGEKELFHGQSIILTPHSGELKKMAQVLGITIIDEIELAKKMSSLLGCVLVLKGYQTKIFSKGKMFVNTSGNSSLATAGTGDVLSGICASFLVEFEDAEKAAIAAVFIHGLAVEKSNVCMRSFTADELLVLINDVLKDLTAFA